MQKPNVTKRFLIEADDSRVTYMLTSALGVSIGPGVSEMNISVRIAVSLLDIFQVQSFPLLPEWQQKLSSQDGACHRPLPTVGS
jgi:hypothetical protein